MPAIYKFVRFVSVIDPHNRQGLAEFIASRRYYDYATLVSISPEELGFFRDAPGMLMRGQATMYEQFYLEASLNRRDWIRINEPGSGPRLIMPAPGVGPTADYPISPEDQPAAG